MIKSITELRSIFEKNEIFSKLDSHNKKIIEPDFWQNKTYSKNIIKEKKLFEDLIKSLDDSNKKLNDLNELYLLAQEEKNQNLQIELLENIKN